MVHVQAHSRQKVNQIQVYRVMSTYVNRQESSYLNSSKLFFAFTVADIVDRSHPNRGWPIRTDHRQTRRPTLVSSMAVTQNAHIDFPRCDNRYP